jgi:predicted  nucleic acid-binding Zn-ribbon protein
MAKYPTRAELMDVQIEQACATTAEQEKNKHLEAEVQRLREQHENGTASTDRKVEEVRRQIQEEDIKREKLREQLKQDMAAMFAEQTEASTQTVISFQHNYFHSDFADCMESKFTCLHCYVD